MTAEQREVMLVEAERWFEQNGLPYFVAANERRVLRALRRTRLAPVALAALAVGIGAGLGFGLLSTDVSTGILVGALTVAAIVLAYALVSLHLQPIVRWAVRQTFGSLGWLFPLITRALPLLLLFMTFLFINTEVWQVSSALDRGLLWLTVLLFAGVATAFLLVRLPEEVRQVSDDISSDSLPRVCAGTPVAAVAPELARQASTVRLSGMQRTNLVLVLLFSQALQVLLLALSVFCFFLLFGKVAISDSVVESWLGDKPTPLPSLDWLPISNQLFQVSVFLAAFSGLYFTVYAVTDENYRKHFFSSIAAELERAVAVQTVYRALRRSATGSDE